MSDTEKHGAGHDTSSSGDAEPFYDPDAGLTEEEKKKAASSFQEHHVAPANNVIGAEASLES